MIGSWDEGTLARFIEDRVEARLQQASSGLATFAPAPVVSSLPTSPVDGQVVDYLADATNGVVWRLKYRAASASGYKWEYVGGAPLFSQALGNATKAAMPNAVFGGVDGSDPAITTPLAGDYVASHGVALAPQAAGAAVAVGVKVGATEPAIGANAVYVSVAAATSAEAMSQIRVLTAVPASTVIQQRYWQNAAAQNVDAICRSLTLTPVRVG